MGLNNPDNSAKLISLECKQDRCAPLIQPWLDFLRRLFIVKIITKNKRNVVFLQKIVVVVELVIRNFSQVSNLAIIGPFFFENEQGEAVTDNGDRYRSMLSEFLFTKLEEKDIGNKGIWRSLYIVG